MKEYNLDKLEKIKDLRQIWSMEVDFTHWLSENLDLLAEAIGNGLELELESTEKSIGSHRLDILCRDVSQPEEHWVVIENQIEKSDHKHLGQLLTYTAGQHATTIIWIAEEIQEDHKAALDWLNENTDEKFCFFGLEIELWRIGNSEPAPKFNIVSQPNNWERSISRSTKSSKTQSNTFKRNYFTGLINYLEASNTFLKLQTPADTYQNFVIGTTGFFIQSHVSPKRENVRVELLMDKKVKHFFFALFDKKDGIEKITGKLDWIKPREKASVISLKEKCDPYDEEKWDEQFAWLKEKLELFHKIFQPEIENAKKLKDKDFERLENEYYESIGEEQEVPEDMLADDDDE